MIDNVEEKYGVGALMYSPALNRKIAELVINGALGDKYSAALCLEDTIAPNMVAEAENQVAETFENIYKSSEDTNIYIPKIFIRVREPEQVLRVFRLIRDYHTLLTGFILYY